MSERMNALAQLLGKSSAEECSFEELQQLTSQYPYFAPAQFLLLQKLKTEGLANVEAQHQKAVLYHNDPLLFDYFISPGRFQIDETAFAEKTISDTSATNTFNVDVIHAGENEIAHESSLSRDNVSTEEEIEPLQENLQPEEFTLDAAYEPIAEMDGNEWSKNEDVNIHIEPLTEDQTFTPTKESEKPEGESAIIVNETIEETRTNSDTIWSRETVTTEPAEEENLALQGEANQLTSNHPADAVHNNAPGNITKTNEATLSFEPYYTVDYFASQGIKPSAEELPKDKLGKQLRSFTEWLKIMKRLPATEITKSPESPAEKTVESLASHSIADSDVVTEAMAEVWTKQGHPEKAIETYNKLSLLLPSKKAYFAAKIENLKQS